MLKIRGWNLDSFPIPMRGNEAHLVTSDTTGQLVSDPHEG